MTVPSDLLLLAAVPAPAALRQLQAGLLSAGIGEAEPVWSMLDAYYDLFTALQARANSREFSDVASLLAPLAEIDLGGTQRAVLATRLYQLLLLVRLRWAFRQPAGTP